MTVDRTVYTCLYCLLFTSMNVNGAAWILSIKTYWPQSHPDDFTARFSLSAAGPLDEPNPTEWKLLLAS